MKRLVGIIIIAILLVAFILGWNLLGPTVKAPKNEDALYVKTGTSYAELRTMLKDKGIISGYFFFDKVASRADLSNNVKPGKYKIEDGSSIINLVKMLKRGDQVPVKFIITKLRTIEDLAAKMGKSLETDSVGSMSVLKNDAFLSTLGLDSNTLMTAVIPNTYNIKWTNTPKEVLSRLKDEAKKFWTDKREKQLAEHNLTSTQAYIIASIVEEETNLKKDKPLVASVYLNRLRKGMKLEADPTVKFAMKDFGLKRILYTHLDYPSPYNTYRNVGLPPGPICTPAINTIDAVLQSPNTDYIFFVADPSLDGTSIFAATYPEHQKNAKAYQDSLNAYILKKQLKKSNIEQTK